MKVIKGLRESITYSQTPCLAQLWFGSIVAWIVVARISMKIAIYEALALLPRGITISPFWFVQRE